jgi:DNA-binding XRE family transcriptional regulator
MKHTIFVTPSGEEMVVLARADFNAMEEALDAAVAAKTLAELASGRQELLTSDEVAAALAAPTPLAFWRAKRKVTQTALAKTIGVSQSYIADLEAGRRKGDAGLTMRLARALHVRMEDLVDDEEASPILQ